MIDVSKIRIDGGTQSRAAINEQTVAEYAEAMEDPVTVFPPIVVYHDGKDYWLADGFHRLEAWKRIGRTEVPAEIRQGDRRKAILHSCAANAAHGLRRTNDDKRRAVMTLLDDEEWRQWSDRVIADACRVSHPFVGKLRAALTGNVSSEEPRTYTTRHGTEAQMDTSRIGKTEPKTDSIPSETEGATTADPDNVGDGSRGSRQPQADADVTRADELAPEAGEKAPAAAGGSPAPAKRHDPYGYAKLTEEALLDLAEGLRAELDDAKKRIRKQTSEIADLKARVKDLEADDKNAVIARQAKQIEHMKSEMFRANDAARIKTVAARKAQDEAAKLRKQVESQEIPL